MNLLDVEIFSHTLGDYLALVPPVVALGFLLGSLESTAYHVFFGGATARRSGTWALGLRDSGWVISQRNT